MAEQPIDLAHLARLAGLELRPADEERLRAQLARVLGYVAQLEALDIEDAGPERETPTGVPLRADEVEGTLTLEQAMAVAVERDGDFFRVPPVMPDRKS